MRPYPPLGLLSIAAWVEREAIEVDVFDTTFSSFDALMERLRAAQPRFVGIYVTLMTRSNVLNLVAAIRATPVLVNTTIILGGPEVTFHADRLLEHGADVIVIGEGEITTTEVIETVLRGGDLSDVAGVAFRREDGSVIRTSPRPLLKQIDSLPMPKRDAIDLQRYLDVWRRHHGAGAVSISTMRGCPFTCRWCSRAVYGETYRRRSPTLVVDEMEMIRDRWNPELIWFVDDVFTINATWTEGFAGQIQERRVRMPYECITRADRLDERSADLLAESGACRVWIGAESGSQRILDAMDRRVTVEQVQRSIRLCRERGIETGTFIMLGYPGETEEDILMTIEHLKTASPDLFTVTTAYPITGTPFHDQVREELIEPASWEASSDRDLRYTRPYSDAYYRHALRRMVHEVELHKLARSGRRLSRAAAIHAAKATVGRVGMRVARWTSNRSENQKAGRL